MSMYVIESGSYYFVANDNEILLKTKGFIEDGSVRLEENFNISKLEKIFLTNNHMLSRIVEYMLGSYYYLVNERNVFLFEIDEDVKIVKNKQPVNFDYFNKIYDAVEISFYKKDIRRLQVVDNIKKIFSMLKINPPEHVASYFDMLQNDDVILLVDAMSNALVFNKSTKTVIDTEHFSQPISGLFRSYCLLDIVKDDALKEIVDIRVYELKEECSGYKVTVAIEGHELTFRPPSYSLKEILDFLDKHNVKYVYIPLEKTELNDKKRIDIVLNHRSNIFKIINDNVNVIKIIYEYNKGFCPEYTLLEFDNEFNLVSSTNSLLVSMILVKGDNIYIIRSAHNPVLKTLTIDDLKNSESELEEFIDIMLGVNKTNKDAKQFLEKLGVV